MSPKLSYLSSIEHLSYYKLYSLIITIFKSTVQIMLNEIIDVVIKHENNLMMIIKDRVKSSTP